jgi:hypothetical protein
VKPHEETWAIAETEATVDVNFPDGHAAEFGAVRPYDAREPSEQDRSRARLAAQAPAMARHLLLTLDDGGSVDEWRAAVLPILRAAGVLT